MTAQAPEVREGHRRGAWPFVTQRHFQREGRPLLWQARSHRKGLLRSDRGVESAAVPVWQSAGYNWLVGALFALGAVLFMLGSTFVLAHPMLGWPAERAINITFFLGSIPFTTAAYLQHFQSANAADVHEHLRTGATRRQRIHLIGWQPDSPGWISTLTQFVGTVAFNFNTFDGIDAPAAWYMQDLVIWLPGFVGSVLFLVSGALAFVEVGHSYWSWRPSEVGWQIAFINLLGCIAFMVDGTLAFVPAGPEPGWINMVAVAYLWLGGLGFLVGALLLMRESRLAR